MIRRFAYMLCFSLLMTAFSACRNDRSSIPDFPVYIERNLTTINCLFPGDSWRITSPYRASDRVGFAGVQLVCAFDNNYYAFDLACPNEAQVSVRLDAPDELLHCTCPRCGEIFDLSFGLGVPMRNIAREPLKRYSVHPLSQQNDILIKN